MMLSAIHVEYLGWGLGSWEGAASAVAARRMDVMGLIVCCAELYESLLVRGKGEYGDVF